MILKDLISLCDAFVLLMHPLLEIVIHDLKSDKICYVKGNLSKRKINDSSLLNHDELENDLNTIIYPKINFNGRLIKSIPIPLQDQWLVCINCDISIFQQIQNLSQSFLCLKDSDQPKSLFKNDWREKIHIAIHTFLEKNNWNFENLNRCQKKEILKHLFNIKAFQEKNSADYVARTLNMGRATVFKYFKEWK